MWNQTDGFKIVVNKTFDYTIKEEFKDIFINIVYSRPMTKSIVDKKLVSIVAFDPHSFSGLGFKLELLSKNVTSVPRNEI